MQKNIVPSESEAAQKEIRRLQREWMEITGRARDINKSSQHLLTEKRMKYTFIAAHEGQFQTRRMCRVVGVGRSGNYAWRKRKPMRP